MDSHQLLIKELKKYDRICYYPSSATDLSDIDFFGSGQLLWEERVSKGRADDFAKRDCPDLFIHTDINFYREFVSGLEELPDECGMNGNFVVTGFRELPSLHQPNRIYENYEFSGKCFEYKIRVWDSDRIVTLLFCLCENEFFVSRILLAGNIKVDTVWTKNWNGGRTYGTWLANILDQLQTSHFFSDWLCIPGQRGEPRNLLVEEKYPELMVAAKIRLERNDEIHWIDQGAHGWVEKFSIVSIE